MVSTVTIDDKQYSVDELTPETQMRIARIAELQKSVQEMQMRIEEALLAIDGHTNLVREAVKK